MTTFKSDAFKGQVLLISFNTWPLRCYITVSKILLLRVETLLVCLNTNNDK